jgi:hypothetical protein
MALSATEANFISKSSAAAKDLLLLYGQLVQLDQLWAGVADFDATITQADIDGVPSFTQSGLTATVLGDAEFALAGIKTAITNALPSLTVLANLP